MTTLAATAHPLVVGRVEEAPHNGLSAAEVVEGFFVDLRNQVLHEAGLAPAPRGDLFRDHMNAMAICYFAIIVLFLLGSLPVLAYSITYNW
jgi:hypothetical protein